MAKKGEKLSEETKAKISKSMTFRWLQRKSKYQSPSMKRR